MNNLSNRFTKNILYFSTVFFKNKTNDFDIPSIGFQENIKFIIFEFEKLKTSYLYTYPSNESNIVSEQPDFKFL